MKKLSRVLFLFQCLWCLPISAYSQGLPSFPGAEGDGALTIGGRGGKVLIVDRFDDPCPTVECTAADLDKVELLTPGTLRWALKQPYKRTVVFRKGGIIRLQPDSVELKGDKYSIVPRDIHITDPYLTIAGQTAAGSGITIAGNGITIETREVVLRHLRFRTGRDMATIRPNQQNPETLMIEQGASNIIIDHCSVSWMPAEAVSIYGGERWDGKKGLASDITLSWNLIGEGLIQHNGIGHPSGGFMVNYSGTLESLAPVRITFHHNMLVHTQKRNADLLSKQSRLINNALYNWQWSPTIVVGGVSADIIGNIWKPGPMTNNNLKARTPLNVVPAASDLDIVGVDDWWHGVSGEVSLYLRGNAVSSSVNIPDDQQELVCFYDSHDSDCNPKAWKPQWRRTKPLPSPPKSVTEYVIPTLEKLLKQHVGASYRLDAKGNRVVNRDLVDARYIEEYLEGTYLLDKFPWHERLVGGYPKQDGGVPYPDKDRDGMSDVWEKAQGLNPKADDSAEDADGDGYTNLEEFLNG